VATAVALLEKETFWAAWQAAQESMPPEERAAEQAELAIWDRASAVDLRVRDGVGGADR